jgi:hypothetical protein
MQIFLPHQFSPSLRERSVLSPYGDQVFDLVSEMFVGSVKAVRHALFSKRVQAMWLTIAGEWAGQFTYLSM